MNSKSPIRIMEADNPTSSEVRNHLTQDGYFTTGIIFKGPKARAFGRQLGILK